MRAERGQSAGDVRAACGRVRAREAAELLANAVYGRQARAPSGIHLQILAISIIFSANLCCVHILLVIYAILHRKNEGSFYGPRFG